MTIKELKATAKELGLTGYSKLNKAALIELIADATGKTESTLQEEATSTVEDPRWYDDEHEARIEVYPYCEIEAKPVTTTTTTEEEVPMERTTTTTEWVTEHEINLGVWYEAFAAIVVYIAFRAAYDGYRTWLAWTDWVDQVAEWAGKPHTEQLADMGHGVIEVAYLFGLGAYTMGQVTRSYVG